MKRPDSHRLPACLLCASEDVHIADRFSFRDLRLLYFETCEVDINSCIDQPYTEKLVYLHTCVNCGLAFYPAGLRGNAKLYEALSKYDYYYQADKWEFSEALKDISGCKSLLEIGCGRGAFLLRVREANSSIRVVGLETNPTALAVARQSGLDIHPALIEEFCIAHQGEFDCICAFQVLEHVERPDRFLKCALQCLRPGGLLIVATPNSQSFTRYAVNNFGDMPPHHLTQWNADVMSHVVTRLGVKLERVEFEPVAEYHKEWYRDVRVITFLSGVIGWKLQRIELGLGYRLLVSLSHRLQKLVPFVLWKYSRYVGHTLYATFRA
jgi:2-polyprenyl-3-methyl-5-hydroxy-6-metoxy-1,4-benzoquinol methylase